MKTSPADVSKSAHVRIRQQPDGSDIDANRHWNCGSNLGANQHIMILLAFFRVIWRLLEGQRTVKICRMLTLSDIVTKFMKISTGANHHGQQHEFIPHR